MPKKDSAVPAAPPAAEYLPLSSAPHVGKPSKEKGSKRRKSAEPAAGEPSTSASEASTGIVYVGHIPHGFYEKQLLGFFSQFGKLKHVRLSRNTEGRSRHYAFLKFQYPEVAPIAAEAMDGYFLMKQRLSCRVLKASQVHPDLWVGANRSRFFVKSTHSLARRQSLRELRPEQYAAQVARLVKRDRKRQKRIAAAGIDYEYEGLAALVPKKAKKIVFED